MKFVHVSGGFYKHSKFDNLIFFPSHSYLAKSHIVNTILLYFHDNSYL